MSLPVNRRPAYPERTRSGWPRDFWDLFGDFTQLWNRMGQLLEPFGGRGAWVPAVETDEADDGYLVRAELPGMRREDIDVELGGGELRITGEISEETGGSTLRRRRGQFVYRTRLPVDADTEKAEARLADGVLAVRLPKTGQSGSRKIEITG
jgi:HSP20 family protein